LDESEEADMTEYQTIEYKQIWKDDERIMQACREAGVPTPEVSCDVNGLWMSFHFLPEHQHDSGHEDDGGITQDGLGEKLGENRQRMLEKMRAEPMISIVSLAQHLELSSTAIENNIRWLKEYAFIRRVGPAKGGYWEVLK